MTDRDFLIWLHQRLVKVHKEREFTDFMHALRDIIYTTDPKKDSHGHIVTMRSSDVWDEIQRKEKL